VLVEGGSAFGVRWSGREGGGGAGTYLRPQSSWSSGLGTSLPFPPSHHSCLLPSTPFSRCLRCSQGLLMWLTRGHLSSPVMLQLHPVRFVVFIEGGGEGGWGYSPVWVLVDAVMWRLLPMGVCSQHA